MSSIHELLTYYRGEPYPGRELTQDQLVPGMEVIVDGQLLENDNLGEIDFFEETPDKVNYVYKVL